MRCSQFVSPLDNSPKGVGQDARLVDWSSFQQIKNLFSPPVFLESFFFPSLGSFREGPFTLSRGPPILIPFLSKAQGSIIAQ